MTNAEGSNSMAEEWQEYLTSVLSGYEIPESNLLMLRMTFYAGALALIDKYKEANSKDREEVVSDTFLEISGYLQETLNIMGQSANLH